MEQSSGIGAALARHFKAQRVTWLMSGLVLLLAVAIRVYQQLMAYSVGTDFYEPEFQTYWMSLLYAELGILALGSAIGAVYIWQTREKDLKTLPATVELNRYYKLISIFAVIAVWAGTIGYLAVESDAAWHQVTIRDTDFTPTHIVIFYFAIPLLTSMLILTALWTHTRLPEFVGKISVPFAGLATGVFMIMPNYGFNEWGHTFFYAEELFSAPIHYGFVVLGWSFFFLVPLVVQFISRMAVLIPKVVQEQQAAAV